MCVVGCVSMCMCVWHGAQRMDLAANLKATNYLVWDNASLWLGHRNYISLPCQRAPWILHSLSPQT